VAALPEVLGSDFLKVALAVSDCRQEERQGRVASRSAAASSAPAAALVTGAQAAQEVGRAQEVRPPRGAPSPPVACFRAAELAGPAAWSSQGAALSGAVAPVEESEPAVQSRVAARVARRELAAQAVRCARALPVLLVRLASFATCRPAIAARCPMGREPALRPGLFHVRPSTCPCADATARPTATIASARPPEFPWRRRARAQRQPPVQPMSRKSTLGRAPRD